MYFSGNANVLEWFDDEDGKFKIEVTVTNRHWGRLFGYKGSFDVTYIDVTTVPTDIKPLREEKRE